MARPFLAVPDTVTVPLKSPQEESRGDGEKEKGLWGSYLGHSVLSRHFLSHRKSASNCPPHLPTGTFLPTCYVRGFLRTPRRGTHVQRYLAPREVGQDLGRTPTTTCGIWSPSVGDGPPFPPNTPDQYYLCSIGVRSGTRNPCPRAPSSEICPSKKTMLQKPSMTFRVSHRTALESNSSF